MTTWLLEGLNPRSTGSEPCSEGKSAIQACLLPTGGHQHPLRSRDERGPTVPGSPHLAAELVLLGDPVEPHCVLILSVGKIMWSDPWVLSVLAMRPRESP